jgi:rRNA maturation protein Nop10
MLGVFAGGKVSMTNPRADGNIATPDSCQTCEREMLTFCKNCPFVETNVIPKGFDPEDWAHAKYRSVKCNDYRVLNKRLDNLIEAIREFETECGRYKKQEVG